MTTRTHTVWSDVARVLARSLPRWASEAQLDILVGRFFDGYDFGWIVAGAGDAAGGAKTVRGAERAARRAATRVARETGGPAAWTHVVRLAEVVDSAG